MLTEGQIWGREDVEVERLSMTNIIIVAFTLFLECADQPLAGKQNVATVIQNMSREHGMDPKTVCMKDRWFSSWNSGDKRKKETLFNEVKSEPLEWRQCLALATGIANGTLPVLSRANHFWRFDCRPSWEKDCIEIYQIGDHKFGYEP